MLRQRVQGRADRRQRFDQAAVHAAVHDAVALQVLEADGQLGAHLVRGRVRVGLDAPRVDDLLALERGQHRIGVPDVDAQQHAQTIGPRRSSAMSRIGDECVSAPTDR